MFLDMSQQFENKTQLELKWNEFEINTILLKRNELETKSKEKQTQYRLINQISTPKLDSKQLSSILTY